MKQGIFILGTDGLNIIGNETATTKNLPTEPWRMNMKYLLHKSLCTCVPLSEASHKSVQTGTKDGMVSKPSIKPVMNMKTRVSKVGAPKEKKEYKGFSGPKHCLDPVSPSVPKMCKNRDC